MYPSALCDIKMSSYHIVRQPLQTHVKKRWRTPKLLTIWQKQRLNFPMFWNISQKRLQRSNEPMRRCLVYSGHVSDHTVATHALLNPAVMNHPQSNGNFDTDLTIGRIVHLVSLAGNSLIWFMAQPFPPGRLLLFIIPFVNLVVGAELHCTGTLNQGAWGCQYPDQTLPRLPIHLSDRLRPALWRLCHKGHFENRQAHAGLDASYRIPSGRSDICPHFLSTFKTTYDSNGVLEGVAVWLFLFSICIPTTSSINTRSCPRCSSNKWLYGAICSFYNAGYYVSATYIIEDLMAEAIGDITNLTQPPNVASVSNAQTLWDMSLCWIIVYDGAISKANLHWETSQVNPMNYAPSFGLE